MLCWECVARLSSANNFLKKALKTHKILMNKINNSTVITMSDIESIDRALESTLGVKFWKENDCNLHILVESDKNIDPSSTENYKYCDKSEVDDIDIGNEEEIVKEVKFSDEKYPIKREYLDEAEEQNILADDYREANLCDEKVDIKLENTDFVIQTFEIDDKQNISDHATEMAIDNVSNISEKFNEETLLDEEIKQSQKNIHHMKTTLGNWGSEALPHCKELRVVVEDVMLTLSKQDTEGNISLKEFTAQDTDPPNTSHPQIKTELLEEKNNELENVDTGAVSSNISFMQVDTESPKNVFICDICGKQFHVKSTFTCHIKKHFKMHRCTYCSYKACQTSDVRHMNCMHTKKNAFNCSCCNYKAYNKSTITAHVNSIHTKTNGYNCSLCSYKTYQKSNLNRHINAVHTKTNDYNCSLCNFKTYDKSSLTKHVKVIHTKTIVYNCSLCNYKAYDKSTLTRHVKLKHSKTNLYNCSLCSYTDHDKSGLTRHVNARHTKNTSYNCSLCNYKTYYPSYLSKHVNGKHTKKISHNCSLCTYKTYHRSDLTKHVNAKHTKNISYSCSLCSYKVYHKQYLIKHINAKHMRTTGK